MDANENTQGRGLSFVLFALCTGLELVGEQRAQKLENHPQHRRPNKGEDEQEHQHNSGVDKEFNHSQSAFPKRSFSA